MGNQEHQEQSTDLESEILSEEPPSFEEQPDLLNKVFDANIDRIDAVELLANAEINLSAFALCGEFHMEYEQKSCKSTLMFESSLEALVEAELDLLSDEEVLCYLQAEGIDCEQFISRTMHLIKDSLIA
ncbi:MAG: hypothetical protein QF840_16045 [Pseudomonadales bacterium]|jgi:hypothetical protein|uniref:Uncharacterized protein n=1 Tax=marine metagenome TaxID=408172 RepID=A0A382MAI2_9ZZZZ|nr:hypothetical protein [Pseudomonadales bacterium]|tara:strand:- start:290 stop:676 length:387 start_codon:yes stop_codon:yes gene_type:complete